MKTETLKILLLEDDQRDSELVCEALAAGGLDCEVTQVRTRAEFEHALAGANFDVIISDFTLPGYDGLAALNDAKKTQPEAPFLFVSGTIGEERAVESLISGATDYIIKGNLERLVPAVRRAVREKEERVRRKNAEARSSAFSALAQRLSAAKTAREAAQVIMEVADALLGWDACTLDLYSPTENIIRHVLNADVINGHRTESTPAYDRSPPSPLALKAISEGGQLILRDTPEEMNIESRPFGDTSRRSASLMFVPIRNGDAIIGVMSIQSYRSRGYDRDSLETLQALADHCGGALNRIRNEEAHKALEQQLRQAQKMEAVGQLAGGIAHDFNNMLLVIRGNADLIQMSETQFSPEVAECLRQIMTASEQAANLTRQLLAFSRKQTMQSRDLNLNELIGNLTKMLRRVIGADINLECANRASLPFIHADPGMIEQVLLNLVINARDAMPKGGRVTISTDEIALNPDYAETRPEARPGEFILLTVSDTGTGIAAEHQPHIFEPFFTTKEASKGTGLGLATVYGIIKQHQGWIELSSTVGAGTSFKIFLPAVTSSAPKDEGSSGEGGIRGGNETILLVEDDSSVRSMTRRVLEKAGYKVLEATSPAIARDIWKAQQANIHLLLTDIIMPGGMTGREFAKELRGQRPDLKVIFTSGYSAEAVGKDTEFIRKGGGSYLQKPYASHALMQSVRQCLDAK